MVRRRWIAGIAGLAIMIALAAPALSINTGALRANALGGHSPAAQALHGLERSGVPSAVVFPIQVLTHGRPAAAAQASGIAARTPGVYTVLGPDTGAFRQGDDALLSVIATNDGTTASGRATVARLRAALAGVPGGVQVGGNTAQNVAFTNAQWERLARARDAPLAQK